MTGVDLLADADRLGGDLPRLRTPLDGPLREFAGMPIVPFSVPFSVPFEGADAPFDPGDHAAVDPRASVDAASVAALAAL